MRCVAARTRHQLERGTWEVLERGEALAPLPTPETKPVDPTSVYALSKYDQERLCLLVGQAYGIPSVALRFFNAYGTRQALSNPYTGVLAIFAARYLNSKPPLIFEDGLQQRDFVSVRDVAMACRLALECSDAPGHVFNIGSGHPHTVCEVAEAMAEVLGCSDIEPEITGKHRVGDIRHCFADISLARRVIGYEPRIRLREGLIELTDWLEGQVVDERVGQASSELAQRGLTL